MDPCLVLENPVFYLFIHNDPCDYDQADRGITRKFLRINGQVSKNL